MLKIIDMKRYLKYFWEILNEVVVKNYVLKINYLGYLMFLFKYVILFY